MTRPLLWALLVAAFVVFSAPSALGARSDLRSGSGALVAVDESLSVRADPPKEVVYKLMLWIIKEVKAGAWSSANATNTEKDWKQNTLAVGITTNTGSGTKIYIGTNKGKNLNGMPDKVTKAGATKGTSVRSLILAQAKILDPSVGSVDWANTAYDTAPEGGHAERRVAKAIDTAGAAVAAIVSNRITCGSCITFFTTTYKTGADKDKIFYAPKMFESDPNSNPLTPMPATAPPTNPPAPRPSKKRPLPPTGGNATKKKKV